MIGRRVFLAGGVGGAALLLGAPTANAEAAASGPGLPPVIDCDSWHARPSKGPIPLLDHRPTMVLVHHTAGPNATDVSQAAAESVAHRIQDFHMDARGWIDSGQHFTISRGGFVLEGRRQSLAALRGGRQHVVGAHCTGKNDVAVGIENEGTYLSATPPRAQLDQLRALCAAICSRYGIAPTEIHGHRDYRDTACPGDRLYGLLPQLRVDVAGLLGKALTLSQAVRPVWPLLRAGDSGQQVLAAQHLLRGAGTLDVEPNGQFGPSTDAAVRRFQTERGTEEVNGVIGGETWPLLTRSARDPDGTRRLLSAAGGGPSGPALADPQWQELLGAVG